MDALLLDCGFPEVSRHTYKKSAATETVACLHLRCRNPTFLQLFACPPCSFCARNLARIKQTARRRRRYVAMSSSSSATSASPAAPSSEETLSDMAVVELQPGHIVEFGTSRIFSGHVLEMQRLGYFGNSVGRALGAEEVLEPEGKFIVFEAFFIVGLRLPTHRFVVEVLRRFEVQVHQLTPNAVVALAKYVWAVSSYGGQPSVEVFTKNYCLHWQKRKIGDKIAQFGSCTFTPRTWKTSAEVVEIVLCARNKWVIGGIFGSMWHPVMSKAYQVCLCPSYSHIVMWCFLDSRWWKKMKTKGPSDTLPA
jgi:hypothetical protein